MRSMLVVSLFTSCGTGDFGTQKAGAEAMESPGNQTDLNAWPIRRDADGTARLELPQLRRPCDSGLFTRRRVWVQA